jgi:hypothetical protein
VVTNELKDPFRHRSLGIPGDLPEKRLPVRQVAALEDVSPTGT